MIELLCDILEIKNIRENEYFLVYSIIEEKDYIIPCNQLIMHNVKVGQRHIFKKEQNLNSKQFFLNYVSPQFTENKNILNNHYKAGEAYDFKIIEFENQENKKGEPITIIYVQDIDNNKISVLALKWQKKEIWKYETIKCEIERILDNGIPRLLNKDFRHPFYTINKEYEFSVIGEKTKETEKGRYDIFQLKGSDDCMHEVNMLPGQKLNSLKLKKINCKIINITYRLSLYQVGIKDPFFVSFDKIENNKELENKYFTNIFKENDKTNKEEVQLIEQYNSKSAFWVFTFTNKVLTKLFRELIDRQDYKQAKGINKLIITFEEWIISKGIITSFPDEAVRESSKIKAKTTLESAKNLYSVLTKLSSNQFDFLRDDVFFKDENNLLERFYHITIFTNIELIEADLFVSRLLALINKLNEPSESDIYYLDKLLKYISFGKKTFISEEEKQNFSLSSYNTHSDNFSKTESKYLIWTYSEILIAEKLSMLEHLNILCGQLLKLYTKSTIDIDKKECLLFNAYSYFENYQNPILKLPFVFNKQLLVNYDLLASNILKINSASEDWNTLENLLKNNEIFSVRLTKKSKTGYEAMLNNLKGFLPYHHIKDKKLKTYPFEESDFTIEVTCLSVSRPFNFFIIEQIENSDTISNHNNNLKSYVDGIYDAIIKRVESYGIFLTTSIGEGLLHKNEIFDFNWESHNIDKYFKSGQKIKVALKNVDNENKLSFNFYSLKRKDVLYYNNYVERIFSLNTEEFFDIEKDIIVDSNFEKTQIEKAFCIEQFAVLQYDINKKLQNFQIAKQFYTNANHARSFLINIYISYFEILLKIQEALQNNSLENITIIKNKAQEIKNKINKKTIDTFPDSDKLIYFLDIVSMFNEKSDSTFELLFEYIKQYNNASAQKDLRTIAKITLANNLLISESKEDLDFILKNLRLIYDYLSNGILSLEESIDDKNARELKEKILYWQEKIKEDESETLEFKSSFFTPSLDENALKRIEILNALEKKTEKTNMEISRINGNLSPKILIHSSLKTLVAFANSSGGTLLIGVDNNKNILGLEQEYLSSNPKLQYPNRDGFGLYFDDMVRNYIGDSFSSLMNRQFLKFPSGDILIVKVEQSNNEVFLLKNDEGKDCEQLYIRNLSSSKELTGSELAKFIKNRQLGQLTKDLT